MPKSNAPKNIWPSTALAILKNPDFIFSVFALVPSGDMAINEPLSFFIFSIATSVRPLPGLDLSTGIPPIYLRNLPRIGVLNKVYFPKNVIFASRPKIAAKPNTPSQLDVCGPAIRIKFSLPEIGGTNPSTFHPKILKNHLANH